MAGRGVARGRGIHSSGNLQLRKQRTPGTSRRLSWDEELLTIRVHLSSLPSGITTDKLSLYFEVLAPTAKVSSPVILGDGKAELLLERVTLEGLQQLQSREHKIHGIPITPEFEVLSKHDQKPPLPEFDEEKGPTMIEVTNVPNVSEEALKTFFEEAKLGGCAGAVADVTKISSGVFHVTFNDPKVAAQVISGTCIFKKALLQLNFVKEVSKLERNSGDISNQIEVSNVPPAVSEDALKAYFEEANSGGRAYAVAECKIIGQGLFRVIFHDPKVAAQVMKKGKHKFRKSVLQLRFACQEEHKFKHNQLTIHGLPDGIGQDVLEVVIANRLGMDDEDDFSLKVSGQSATIMFIKDYSNKELQQMILDLTSQPVRGVIVTAEMCKVIKPSIHVKDITTTLCDEEFLGVYFGSHKRSGGGEVESIEILGDNEAMVTFSDPTVIQSVLERQHTTLGHKTLLHEVSTDTPPSQEEQPFCNPPMTPLEVEIDPLFVQSLSRSSSGLEQSIMKSNVTFAADEKAGFIVVSPTRESKSSWQEECQKEVLSYVASSLTKEEIDVPKEAAAKAVSAVVKLEKENPSLVVIPNHDGTIITIAGELGSVSQAKESINTICSALTDTASEVLSPKDFDFMQQIKKADMPPTIECSFDRNTFKILLKGPIGVVSEFKRSMISFVQHVEVQVDLEPLVTEFFSTENGRKKLIKFLQERQCQAALHFSPHPHLTLFLLCKSEDTNLVKAVTQALLMDVSAQTIPIPDTVAPILSDLEEFNQLCQKVEREHGVLVKQVGHKISAAGFKTDMNDSLTEIGKFLTEKASPIPPAEIKVGVLVARSLHKSPRGIEKHLQPYPVQIQIDAGGVIHLSPMHYLKDGWEDSCKSSVLKYIHANIAEVQTDVPLEAFSEIIAILIASERNDNTFVFNYTPHSTALSYAGNKSTVKSTQESIAQICTGYSKKVEDMVLDPEDFEFLCHLKLQDLNSRYQSTVDIEPQFETHSLLLTGTVKGVNAVKDNMPLLTVHTKVPVMLEEALAKYCAAEKSKEKLYAFLKEKSYNQCVIYISKSPMKLDLLCASKHKRVAERAAKAIQESMCVVRLQIPDLLLPFLTELPDFTKKTQTLEKQNSVQIYTEHNQIILIGFQDGVSESSEGLSAFIQRAVVHFQPTQVPVDPLIAKCIESSPSDFHGCMAAIQVKATIKAEQSSVVAFFSPTKAAKPGWKEECQSALKSYIEATYSREEIEVPKPAAGEVIQALVTSSKRNVFHFELCNDGSRAILAGDRNVVQAVQAKISEICNEHQTNETIQLTGREYSFFTQVVLPRLRRKIKIECEPAKLSVVLGGSIREVSDMKNAMKEMVKHSTVPVSAEAMVLEFFITDGKQDLASHIQKKGLQVAFHGILSVQPPSLEFLCDPRFEAPVKEVARKILEDTQVGLMELPESLVSTSMAQEFAEHCKQLEAQFRVSIKAKENELRIGGFRTPVIDAKKSLESYIRKKCSTKKPFLIQAGIWRLFSGPMKPQWMKIEIQCKNNEVELTAPVKEEGKFSFFLTGDKVEVQKICQSIARLIQSVITAVVTLHRPGLCKYFSEGEKGRMMIPGIESTHNVCIEVVEVGEQEDVEQTATRAIMYGGAPTFLKECVAEVLNMKQISIITGDITEFRADVIVNAANEDLKHIGGVAFSILKKGGQIIQQESDRYVRVHGKLKPGSVWLSNEVGNLPCFALIHAVGPEWKNNLSNRQQLQKVCLNCFKEAKAYNSIALPAISAGFFGCPMDQCANILISAAIAFCKTHHLAHLQEINFVLQKRSDAPHFIKALEDHLPSQNIRRRSDSSAREPSMGAFYGTFSSMASTLTPGSASDEDSCDELDEVEDKPSSVSPLNRVYIQQGSILDVEAQIYVNSTNGNMDLTGGAVSQALAKAAGPSLQAECTKLAPLDVGEIAVTGPGNILRCKHILHINCPGYDHSGGQAEDVLRSIMHKCMEQCDRSRAGTIVFPAIGTGNLGFPCEVAAYIMVDEVCNYLEENKCKTLRMVYFIIYMEDMLQTFKEEVAKRKPNKGFISQPRKANTPRPKKSRPQISQYRGCRDIPPPQQKYRGQRNWPDESPEPARVTKQGDTFYLGSLITVEVLKGDIAKEKTEVIVNSTNREMRLEGYGVAAALRKKAGSDLQKACDEAKKARGECMSEGMVIDTRPGKLKCKRVFHILFESNDKTIFATIIRSCIEQMIHFKYSSISFPAIGTGTQNFSASEAANGMINALLQCHPPYPVCVHIVLPDNVVYGVFKTTFDDCVEEPSGWWQKIRSMVPSIPWGSSSQLSEEGEKDENDVPREENEKVIELKIYGETKEYVNSAEESLTKLINMQFKTDDYEDDRIRMLSRSQEKTLLESARRMQVVIDIDRALTCIQLKGSMERISEMKVKIMEVLTQVDKEASRRQQAEMMMKVVQWKRMDSSETPYDPLTNLEIEEALTDGKPKYVFKHPKSAENFTIDFKTMEEIDHAMNDQACKVRRVAEGVESEGGLPDDWDSMTDPSSGKVLTLRVIDLLPNSKGYTFALAEFNKTMTQGNEYTAIVRIQRIQNPTLYGQYTSKKKKMDAHTTNEVDSERWLFHGTTSSAVPQINQTNFNRSFRGQNGTVYGQGTYFARDASYSDRYATPDDQGLKHIYLVRVLTGEFTQGGNAMLVPPAKDPTDSTVLFDSVVDDISNPEIFVVFYDADAYPEYLIVYQ